jgi:hypothetical protein
MAGTGGLSHERWQSGRFDMYCAMMLERPPILIMLPMFLFSMLCLGTSCVAPRLMRWTWVQVGIICGGLLSLTYLVVVIAATGFPTLIAAAFVGPALWIIIFLLSLVSPRARRVSIWQLLVLTTLTAIVLSVGIRLAGLGLAQNIVSSILLGILIATPTLTCITYMRCGIRAWSRPRTATERKALAAGIVTWLVAWSVSLKFAIDAMWNEYEKLPKSPPDCFVSSAAAHGHAQFVGVASFAAAEAESKVMPSVTEVYFPVNMQMCRLKLVEFSLAGGAPALHRLIRCVYNRIGPGAAQLCRGNRWLADASYLMLKPIELLGVILQFLLRIPNRRLRSLYKPSASFAEK